MNIPERPEIFKMILLINLKNEQDCNYVGHPIKNETFSIVQ